MAELTLLALTVVAGLVTGGAFRVVGIAGSVVAVPLLLLIGVPVHGAVAASAAGLVVHGALQMRGAGATRGLFVWPMSLFIAFGIAAAIGGAVVISGDTDDEVMVLAGFTAIAVGIGMLRPPATDEKIQAETGFAISLRFAVAGAVIGFLTGVSGMGGGLVVVWSALVSAVPTVAAQSALAAAFAPMALAVVIVFAVAGLVIWPVTGAFAVAVVIGQVLAQRLALPAEGWRETFAVVSMLVGLAFVAVGAKALGVI